MRFRTIAVAFVSAAAVAGMFTSARAAIPEAAHPDFDLREIKMPAKYKTMGLSFLYDGTLVLATTEAVGGGEVPAADPAHAVYLVKGASTDTLPTSITMVANWWKQIAGIVTVNNAVYVSDRDGFYQIEDLSGNADAKANRKLIASWPDENHWNNGFSWHQWVFTPLWSAGRFYAPYSGSIQPGGWSNTDPTTRFSGAFLSWDMTGTLQAYAGGLRSPNGAAIDAATGEFFVTDNQGSWLPSSTLLRIRPARFYGHRQSSPDYDSSGAIIGTHPPNFAEGLTYDPPVAWLPHGAVRSSPSQPAQIPQGAFAGDWLIGDVNNPGLVRVSLDRVGDQINGTVFWFSRGFGDAAINRMIAGPDGSIYIGTIMRVAGNWPGGDDSPLFKLTARDQPSAFDVKAVRSLADGLELEFTQPVSPDSLSLDHFKVTSWQYIRQREYGQGRQPDVARPVAKAEASRDRKRVHLVLSGVQTDRVYYVKLNGLVSSGGKPLWNDEAWLTLNAISPRAWDPEAPTAVAPARGALMQVDARARGGSLDVTVTGAGPWTASLISPDGTLRDRKSGAGPGRFSLAAGAAAGLRILEVRRGNAKVTRKIFF